MENLKIEKGIPVKKFYEKGMTALLGKMEVGDSVFFDGQIDTTHMRNRSYGIAKRLGMKIVVRKVEGGSRLWRIE